VTSKHPNWSHLWGSRAKLVSADPPEIGPKLKVAVLDVLRATNSRSEVPHKRRRFVLGDWVSRLPNSLVCPIVRRVNPSSSPATSHKHQAESATVGAELSKAIRGPGPGLARPGYGYCYRR
jgi:hypothetical protein